MSKPKTIDLTKLTPEERCRVMVDTVDSRYSIKNYRLNQPDVETTTTNPLIDQQAIVDFKRNNTELYPYKYGEIKIEPNVITYNGKIYVAIDSLNPTFEECVKEWNDWGYELYKGKNHIHFRQRNDYDDYGLYDEYIFHPIQKYYVANNTKVTFEMFQLIIKTMKALEVENG